jgi:hypothetical protein
MHMWLKMTFLPLYMCFTLRRESAYKKLVHIIGEAEKHSPRRVDTIVLVYTKKSENEKVNDIKI